MLTIRVKLTFQTLLNTNPSRQDEPFQWKGQDEMRLLKIYGLPLVCEKNTYKSVDFNVFTSSKIFWMYKLNYPEGRNNITLDRHLDEQSSEFSLFSTSKDSGAAGINSKAIQRFLNLLIVSMILLIGLFTTQVKGSRPLWKWLYTLFHTPNILSP